jgi:hypothetical protein
MEKIKPEHIEVIQNGDELFICRICGEHTSREDDCCGAGEIIDFDLDMER